MLARRSTLLSFACFSLRCSIAFSILFLPPPLFSASVSSGSQFSDHTSVPQTGNSNTAVLSGSLSDIQDLRGPPQTYWVSLSFNNMPRWFIYMVKLQKQCSNFLPLAIFSNLCSLYSWSDPKLRVTILNKNFQIYSSDHEILPSFFNKLLNICYGFSMDNVSCSKEVLISSLCSFFLITINEHFPRHLGLHFVSVVNFDSFFSATDLHTIVVICSIP